jgi:hypothetical protein
VFSKAQKSGSLGSTLDFAPQEEISAGSTTLRKSNLRTIVPECVTDEFYETEKPGVQWLV